LGQIFSDGTVASEQVGEARGIHEVASVEILDGALARLADPSLRVHAPSGPSLK
jgi:hypothetical protein